MDPVSGMLLGGAALGGLNSMLGIGASAVDAALQYHYAKKMYQHRYRWAMDDMRKAGLNPILAANGGSVAGMSSAPSTDFAGAVNGGVSSAMQAARTISDLQAQQVTNAKTEAEEKYAKANTNNVNARTQWQTIQNGILSQQERALVEDAQARATNNSALAALNSARAEYAGSLAAEENASARLGNEEFVQNLRLKNLRNNIISKSPEYNMSKEERIWLERAKVATGAVNSAASSVLSGAKAFRFLK